MKIEKIVCAAIAVVVIFCVYGLVGTSTRVDEIKARAPGEISQRGWKILRYEGYQFGSFSKHGGKVWYHVKDLAIPDTYYRVYITLWGDELHYVYGKPESLNRINLNGGAISVNLNN